MYTGRAFASSIIEIIREIWKTEMNNANGNFIVTMARVQSLFSSAGLARRSSLYIHVHVPTYPISTRFSDSLKLIPSLSVSFIAKNTHADRQMSLDPPPLHTLRSLRFETLILQHATTTTTTALTKMNYESILL